ncbi:MAG: hypothetical protein HQL57_03365 [Magnetococcales bacterium]|nr:hypothetical protein [Magnetococcales bacterium]MBF0156207.1 hypothetical protein [Magnetococcales bacterium]
MDLVGSCHACRTGIAAEGFGRRDGCPRCGRDTRVCLNCRFHDPGAYNQCRENQAERVIRKDAANFCDFFKPGPGKGQPLGGHPKEEASPRNAAESLFKNSS